MAGEPDPEHQGGTDSMLATVPLPRRTVSLVFVTVALVILASCLACLAGEGRIPGLRSPAAVVLAAAAQTDALWGTAASEPVVRVAISQSLGLNPRFGHPEVTLVAPGGLAVWSAAQSTPVFTSAPGQLLTFRCTQVPGDSSDLWLWVAQPAQAATAPTPASPVVVGPFDAHGVYVKPVDPADTMGIVNLSRPAARPYPQYRGILQIIPVPPSAPASSSLPWTPPLAAESSFTSSPASLRPPRSVGRMPPSQVEPGALWVVNDLPLEEYLYSVVPIEMPADFAPAALQAQAIAARTYALYQVNQTAGRRAGQPADAGSTSQAPGGSATSPIPAWADLGDSEAWQSYYGVTVEKPTTTAAVQATRRQVITYQGQPIVAFYSSTAGGHTESAGNAWAQAGRPGPTAAYLVGVPDDPTWGDFSTEEAFRRFLDGPVDPSTSFDAGSPYFRWRYVWTRAQLEQQLFAALTRLYKTDRAEVNGAPVPPQADSFGQLVSLNVRQRGVSGRAMLLEIVTTAGRWSVYGDLNIRSLLAPTGRSLLPSSALVIDLLPPALDADPASPSATTTSPDPTASTQAVSSLGSSLGPATSSTPSGPPHRVRSSDGASTATPPRGSVPPDGSPDSAAETLTPAPETLGLPPTTVIIRGTGYGHGVGLSQWGAHGMARAGYDAASILAHYYPQTTLALVAGAPRSGPLDPSSPPSYCYTPLSIGASPAPAPESDTCGSPTGNENK